MNQTRIVALADLGKGLTKNPITDLVELALSPSEGNAARFDSGNRLYVPAASGGSAPQTYDTLDKNLAAYDYTLAYNAAGVLTSKTWSTPLGPVVKTFSWSGGVLQSMTLSGAGVPADVTERTKTLIYTGGVLSGAAYS